jgi:hypothetical protein
LAVQQTGAQNTNGSTNPFGRPNNGQQQQAQGDQPFFQAMGQRREIPPGSTQLAYPVIAKKEEDT